MLDRKLRRRVERAFYDYEVYRQCCVTTIAERAESGLTANYGAVGSHSGVGNPTERKALKGIDDGNAYAWCTVVEKTLAHFSGTGKDTLIRLRYFEKLSERKVCEKLYIERRGLYYWVEEILTYAAMLALQFRLITIS